MRVCELMVGDLVLHDGKVIRVDAVHKRKIGYHKTKDNLTWLFSGQFEPIFLTTSILEKNGSHN
jgi:tartrate dehydratase beta subunit/fumarate hydratase class I family protein